MVEKLKNPPLCLGLFGDPVSHSLSPLIHARFAAQTGHAVDYRAYAVTSTELAEALEQFAAVGGAGLNLTVPHKQTGMALCHALSSRAQVAGAVNTLKRMPQDNAEMAPCWYGDNTDGMGLLWDLQENLAWRLAGRPLVIVGLGGAAAGVLASLLQLENPWREVILVNRNLAKVQDWWQVRKTELQRLARCPLRLCALDQLQIPPQSLLINATACGHQGLCPDLPQAQGEGLAYDLNYGPASRPFLHWVAAQTDSFAWSGADGLGMLVGQAAAAFAVWTGTFPDPRPVLAELRRMNGL